MHLDLQFTENVEIGAYALLNQDGLEVVEQDNFLEVRNLKTDDEPRTWEFSLPVVDIEQTTTDYDSVLAMWSSTKRGLYSFNFTDFIDDTTYRVRFASQVQVSAPAGHLRHIEPFTVREVLEVSPEPTVAPAITGTATVGNDLTVSDGTWSGSPVSYAYQWTRNLVEIEGETADTYTLVIGDSGKLIGCSVTATDANGASTRTWAAEVSIA